MLLFSQSLPDHPQLQTDLAWKFSLADKPVQALYSCHKADSSLYGDDCTFPTESPMGKAGNKRNPEGIHPAEQGSSCLLLRGLTWQAPPAHPIGPCLPPKASLRDLHTLLRLKLPIPPALCHHTERICSEMSWWLQLCGGGAGDLLWGGTGSPSVKIQPGTSASPHQPNFCCPTREADSKSRTSAQGLCASTQTLIQLQPCLHGSLRGSKKMMAKDLSCMPVSWSLWSRGDDLQLPGVPNPPIPTCQPLLLPLTVLHHQSVLQMLARDLLCSASNSNWLYIIRISFLCLWFPPGKLNPSCH